MGRSLFSQRDHCPVNSSILETKIRTRIRSEGRITFAEFMETVLYDPEDGYYAATARVSESGDFFTSPSAHPAFGALICVQLHEMWRVLGSPAEFAVIEYGAGSGVLASDIQAHASRFESGFDRAMTYTALDRASAAPMDHTLDAVGCVISNELLDAFPAHRFVVTDGTVKELWVVERDGVLTEEPGQLSHPAIGDRLEPLRPGLPDGYTSEVNLGLGPWAESVSRNIRKGFVLTIDYGYPSRQYYSRERTRGTLRCYYRHTLNANPFQHIGQQDLSVHVDFTALDEALSDVGFSAVGITVQADFLARLGIREFRKQLDSSGNPRRKVAANRMAIDQILRRDGLGAFKVAIHSKAVDCPRLTGLASTESGEPAAPAPSPPLPLLDDDPRRVRLFEGAYPQATEFTGTWDELLGVDAVGEDLEE